MPKKTRTRKPSARTGKPSAATPAKKHWLRELVETAVFAVVFVLTVHTFIFQPFIVPTPSMAGTVLAGDYLIVSKLHYGPQTPRTLGIPFTDVYWDGFELPNWRLPGLSEVYRGDVVVFHLPTDEKPLDKRQPYLKRAIGLPGDTLELRDKDVFINGKAWQMPGGVRLNDWLITTQPGVPLPFGKLRELGIDQISRTANPGQFLVRETAQTTIDAVTALPYVAEARPYAYPPGGSEGIFPPNRPFNRDQYGPLYIPKAGQTVALTDDTWPAYAALITRYEGHTAQRTGPNAFEIDGTPATTYTFGQDYYFMMGDNRDNSLDSRFWGYVPADHVMGKAVLTFFSWNQESNRPRLNRLLHVID